ncbi:MAG: outer membrane lipoprotein carrier protein LolA [Candidatus Hydrogenedentes bacterium]|nr:outer membrane lipoprotein carrier protein LolA [Candidatus Hydrogenedentota bacterium]
MKNWTDPWFPLGLFGLVLLCYVSSGAADDTGADRFFKAFTQSRDRVIALEAPFTQTVITPDETIVARGTLTYIRPRRVIYRMDDPERVTLVDDTRGYEYDAEIRQVTVFDLGNNPQAEILFMGFVDTLDTLRKAYDLEIFSVPGEPRGSKGLEIRPKAGTEAESYFVRVRLYLRDQDYLPWRILIRNDENTETHIEIGEINTAYRPDPAATQILLPEGTKVIENDQVIETIGPGGKRVPDALLLPPDIAGTSSAAESRPPIEAPGPDGVGSPASSASSLPGTSGATTSPAPAGNEPTRSGDSVSSEPAAGHPSGDATVRPESNPPRRNPKQVGGPRRNTS